MPGLLQRSGHRRSNVEAGVSSGLFHAEPCVLGQPETVDLQLREAVPREADLRGQCGGSIGPGDCGVMALKCPYLPEPGYRTEQRSNHDRHDDRFVEAIVRFLE